MSRNALAQVSNELGDLDPFTSLGSRMFICLLHFNPAFPLVSSRWLVYVALLLPKFFSEQLCEVEQAECV